MTDIVPNTMFRRVVMAAVLASIATLSPFAPQAVADEKTADADARSIETGAIKQDARVAPVKRVFPKTPTDRELNRMSNTKSAKAKPKSKTKKR